MVRINFRKGAVTLEALGCSIIILFCLMMVFHIYFQSLARILVEEACVQVSHDVVSCSSFEEAEELAEEEVQERLDHYRDIDASSIECEVYYAIGSEQEWKKGNFLTVEVSAKPVSPFSPVNFRCRKIMTVMIERNEG